MVIRAPAGTAATESVKEARAQNGSRQYQRRLHHCNRIRVRPWLVQSCGEGNRWLGPLGGIAAGALLNLIAKQRVTSFVAHEDTETLEELRGLIEEDRLEPVIDSEHPLERAAEAVALVRGG